MRRIVLAIGLAFVLCAAVIGWLAREVDARVASEIVRAGDSLGVPVGLEQVDLSAWSGTGTITGLTIGNPPGYASESALDMRRLEIRLRPHTLLFGPVIVDEIRIESPRVHLERRPGRGSNLQDITESVARKTSETSSESDDAGNTAAEGGGDGEPGRVAVRHLVIEGATFELRRAYGEIDSGSLRRVEVRDIGGETGTSAAGVGIAVSAAIFRSILEQAAEHELRSAVEDQVEALGDRLRGLLDKNRSP